MTSLPQFRYTTDPAINPLLMLSAQQKADMIDRMFSPESETERAILQDSGFQRGLFWGLPRYGHPEGQIIYHIREVLDNIDRLDVTPDVRSQLRLVAFIHDTFKYRESEFKSVQPRDWSKHHSVFAWEFAKQYTSDPRVLMIIRQHDEAYYAWQMIHLYNKPKAGRARLQRVMDLCKGFEQLYYLFFLCDTRTGDKNQAPLRWFERTVVDIQPVRW